MFPALAFVLLASTARPLRATPTYTRSSYPEANEDAPCCNDGTFLPEDHLAHNGIRGAKINVYCRAIDIGTTGTTQTVEGRAHVDLCPVSPAQMREAVENFSLALAQGSNNPKHLAAKNAAHILFSSQPPDRTFFQFLSCERTDPSTIPHLMLGVTHSTNPPELVDARYQSYTEHLLEQLNIISRQHNTKALIMLELTKPVWIDRRGVTNHGHKWLRSMKKKYSHLDFFAAETVIDRSYLIDSSLYDVLPSAYTDRANPHRNLIALKQATSEIIRNPDVSAVLFVHGANHLLQYGNLDPEGFCFQKAIEKPSGVSHEDLAAASRSLRRERTWVKDKKRENAQRARQEHNTQFRDRRR